MTLNHQDHFQLDSPGHENKIENSSKNSDVQFIHQPFWRRLSHKKLRWLLLIVPVLIIGGLAWFIFNVASAFNKISDPVNRLASGKSISAVVAESGGRVNILIVGKGGSSHKAGQLADTIMVASIDTINNKLAIISVPRDLRVITNDGSWTKINAVHAFAEQKSPGSGPAALANALEEILGISVHYYFAGDFTGFIRFVDELGGIEVDVPQDLYDPLFPDKNLVGFDPFFIHAGQQRLSGEIALKYARSRQTTSDFDRSRRQQIILLAIKEKLTSRSVWSNPRRMINLINILGDHLRTNLSFSDIEALIKLGQKIDSDNIITKVLDNSPEGPLKTVNQGSYYLVPKAGDYSEIHHIVATIFDTVDSKVQSIDSIPN